ncbi:MAG: Peptidase inhibitor, partial [Actinomycetota bacterium]
MSGAAVVTDVFDSVFNGVIVNLTSAEALFLRRDPRVLRIEANRMVAASDVPPSW